MTIKPYRFSEKDIHTRVEWINNPSINESMFFELPASVEKTLQWYKMNIGNKSRIDFTFYSAENLIIAMGGFTGINKEHNNAEFYVMVNPTMHGIGIGKKVSLWMYNYAFSVLDLNKVYLYTNDNNSKAYKIYEKAGFKLEGVLREHKWRNGRFQNRRFYGLLKSEWKTLEWKKKLNDVL